MNDHSTQQTDGREGTEPRDVWQPPELQTMTGSEVALLGTEENPCATGTLQQNAGPLSTCDNT